MKGSICMTKIKFIETCHVHSWWQRSVLCCSMQHTEEVSTSTETTRTASVQETTTTVISGDNLENSTVTTTVTESSQQVTSSGDAPITGKFSGSCMLIVISVYLYIKEKTSSETMINLKQIFNKYSLDLHVNSCSFWYVHYFFSCQLNSHFLCTCTYMCLKFILNHLLINGWLSCV